jgi:hypothetical protein
MQIMFWFVVLSICAMIAKQIFLRWSSVMSLSLNRAWIAMPFWVENDTPVKFVIIALDYLTDDATYLDTLQMEINKFAWLNHQNPDWKWLTDPMLFSGFAAEPGDNVFNYGARPICAVELNLNPNPKAGVDNWYGSASVANYGMAFFGNVDGPCGPAIFINSLKSLLHPPDVIYDHVYISLKRGISGSGTITAIAPYPYVNTAVYPSGEAAFWQAYERPVSLGLQIGSYYQPLQNPPLGG